MARKDKPTEWHGVRPGDIFVYRETSRSPWLVVDLEPSRSLFSSPFAAIGIGENPFLGDCVKISDNNEMYVFQSVELVMREKLVRLAWLAHGELFATGDDIRVMTSPPDMTSSMTFSLSGEERRTISVNKRVQPVKIVLAEPRLVYTPLPGSQVIRRPAHHA